LGFRLAIAAHSGRSVSECIVHGVVGMYKEWSDLPAENLSKVDLNAVSKYFDLPLVEKKEESPSDLSVLRLLAEKLRDVITETGRILLKNECRDFADFILGREDDKSLRLSADGLVSRLVSTFPAFHDHHVIVKKRQSNIDESKKAPSGSTSSRKRKQASDKEGEAEDASAEATEEVLVLKKVQLLTADLYRRFKDEDPRLAFPDVHRMTIFADNVLPTVLRHLNIFQYSEKLAHIIDSNQFLSDVYLEAQLRAGSVVVGERMMKLLHDRVSVTDSAVDGAQVDSSVPVGSAGKVYSFQLDYYLWSTGRTPDMKKLVRHATIDTVYY